MRHLSTDNFRGAIFILPLIAIAVAMMLVARRDDTYSTTPREQPAPTADTIATSTSAELPRFRPFDPNEADYDVLIEAGLPRPVAVGIIRWRAAGKVYRIKEDVALLYDMSDSLYRLIEPYIIIGEHYRITTKRDTLYGERDGAKGRATIEPTPFVLDSVTAGYLRMIGFSARQAELIISYREMIGGYRSLEEFAECYAVGAERAEELRPYILFPPRDTTTRPKSRQITLPLEINSADSASLRQVKGIGSKSVEHIIRYRELLGGFYSAEQISELRVVTEENFQRILQQIWCDSAQIKKISINFAGPKALEAHPYITSQMLRRIINHRELKGGWSTIEEMIDSEIFTEEEAKRIAPYLDFGTDSK